MKYKKLVLTMIGLGLSYLFLVSCARTSPKATLEFPTGTFIHNKNQTWAFQFNKDGTWAYFFGNLETPEVHGTYSVDGNLYTETSANDPSCPWPATYKWTYDGQNLTFHLFGEDKCGPRKGAYDG